LKKERFALALSYPKLTLGRRPYQSFSQANELLKISKLTRSMYKKPKNDKRRVENSYPLEVKGLGVLCGYFRAT
jgi:hypothetical protein